MEIALDTAVRATIAIEKNKSDSWSVAAYLITADGSRDRRNLGIFETYREATQGVRRVWTKATL